MTRPESQESSASPPALADRIAPGLRERAGELRTLLEVSGSVGSDLEERLERLEEWVARLKVSPYPGREARKRLSLLLGGGREGQALDGRGGTLADLLDECRSRVPGEVRAVSGLELRSGDGGFRLRPAPGPRVALIWAERDSAPDLSGLRELRELFERVSLPGTLFQFAWTDAVLPSRPEVAGVRFQGGLVDPWA